MTWIFGNVDLPAGGEIRSVGRRDVTAYNRAYYHAKRKARVVQKRTPAQLVRARERRMQQYYRNVEHERANARARYWANRDRYATASRERQRRLREEKHG